ncbi:hypothetical protein FS837_006406 [Tulasnella sp. UAMH 9824]|nr:hypothetical protein FS837_006406 [Tulasnella sp. UAMH 9824]
MLAELHQANPSTPLDKAAWGALLFEAYSHNYHLRWFEDVGRVAKRIRLLEELCAVRGARLTMEEVEELQKQAVSCGLPLDSGQAVELQELAECGAQWWKNASMVLDLPIIALEDLNKLVALPSPVPVFPSLLERIGSVRGRAREFEKQAKAILYPSVGRRTPIQEAMSLVSTTQKDFLIPAVQILAEVVPLAAHIEKICFDIINNRYSPEASHKPLFEELWDMRKTVQKKLWMFVIPSFNIVDQQLVRHDAWLEKLPWYRSPEPAMQGMLIVHDVEQNTRLEDDTPPSDPECTCTCALPVKVTVKKRAGVVQCNHCGARFHSKCIEGSCPFCDHHHWDGSLTKTRNFEYLDLSAIARAAPELTRNYSLVWKHAEIIITCVGRLTRAIDIFLAAVNERTIDPAPPHFIPQTRHFLRKLCKMQFSVKARADLPSYGLILCHIHPELETDLYVDTKACLENFSWEMMLQRLPPPTDYTIILELERFVPGSNQYPESSLAAKPPAPAPQPQSSAGSSTPIPREPSQTPSLQHLPN